MLELQFSVEMGVGAHGGEEYYQEWVSSRSVILARPHLQLLMWELSLSQACSLPWKDEFSLLLDATAESQILTR